MGRTQHTNDIIPRVQAEVERLNADGSLPPGVKIVPYYDRSSLVGVTTHTVLHNLIFGCLLVFFIQWIFLGDLRSAIIVSANIPFALFFAIIILVLQGEDANLLSLGAVDFGIIVDSAVIMMENIFRNFQSTPRAPADAAAASCRGLLGRGSDLGASASGLRARSGPSGCALIFVSALQVDKAVFFTAAITVAAFVPLFTMQGVEGQIFGPMARTYGYALAGALIATFTVTPVLASLLLPKHVEETETIIVRALRSELYAGAALGARQSSRSPCWSACVFLALSGLPASRLGSEFLPALEEGNFWIRAAMPPTMSLDAGTDATQQDARDPAAAPGGRHGGVAARPARQWQRCLAVLQCRIVRAAEAVRRMARQTDQGKTDRGIAEGIQRGTARDRVQLLAIYPGQCRGSAIGRQRAPTRSRSSGRIWRRWRSLATQVMAEMSKVQGVADLGIFHVLGQPNLNIKIDREKAARYGLNTGDVNTVVQAALGGTIATTVLEGDRQFNLAVRLDPKYRSSIDAIRTVKVAYQTPSGTNGYVPLSELADITLDTGASFIYRERSQRFIPIKFSVRGRDLGSTVAEAQDASPKPSNCRTDIRSSGPVSSMICRTRKQRLLDRSPDHAASDPRPALWAVQFVAR